MRTTDYAELDPDAQELIDGAREAFLNGFNPYSGFLAGAAARIADGTVIRGANMFISSTGLSQCAEVTALTTANTAGARIISAMAVVSGRLDESDGEAYPSCGRCRQVLHEFSQLAGTDIQLYFSNPGKTTVVVTSIRELLPMAYTSGALKAFRATQVERLLPGH